MINSHSPIKEYAHLCGNRRNRYRPSEVLLATSVAALIASLLTVPALAQPPAPHLFPVLSDSRLAGATPAQSALLEEMRRRTTTQTLHLVRINQAALKGNRIRIRIPGDGDVTLSKTGGETKNDREFTWAGTQTGKEPAS